MNLAINDRPGLTPVLDEEFLSLFPPLGTAERRALEKELLANPNRLPEVAVWAGTGILVAGYEFLEICSALHLPYQVKEIPFLDREAVFAWIIRQQLARNLPALMVNYLRGKQYLAEKNTHGGARRGSFRENGSTGNNCLLKTDAKLAQEFHVAPRTIRNDGRFAKNIDALAAILGDRPGG